MAGKQSAAMDEAKRLILTHKIAAGQAAALAGVSLNSIYRSKWWKDHQAIKAQEPKA